MSKKNVNDIKNLLFKKVQKYDLKEEILNKIFNKVLQYNNDEEAIFKEFTLEFEKFLVEQINNGDIDLQIKIIEANSFLKVLFQRNPKYKVEENNINRLYEDAVELSIENYDGSDSLSMIILKNMKKMSFDYPSNVKKEKINEKAKTIQVHEEVISKEVAVESANNDINSTKSNEICEREDSILNSKTILIDKIDRVDLSFLNLLIKNGIMNRVELSEKLKISLNLIDKVLSGEYKLKETHLINLYKKYNVNDVYSLEEKIRNKCENSNVSEKEDLRKEFSEEQKNSEKLYDLSFFKEYILLFKIDKSDFAKLIQCGYLKLEEVLDGKVLVKESLMWKLYLEFKVNSYEELKNIIETKVKLKKIRDKYKTDMPPIKGNCRGFNIGILNEYFKYSGKNEKIIMAKSIGISTKSLNAYLKKKIINSKNMKKIFTYFNVENYDQFIEVILKKISQFKKENDLSFLNEYYILSKEDYGPLASKIGIAKSTFETYIKTDSSNLRKYLKSIYEYFGVQSYDELRVLIQRRIRNLKLNQKNIFDIDGNKLVYEYYRELSVEERKELANIMGISPSTLKCYMENRKKNLLLEKSLKKLLDYYKVEKLSELKEIFDKKINEKKKNKENIFDMDGNKLVYEYYRELSAEERKELANIMGISPSTLKCYMDHRKENLLLEKSLKKLLDYYKVEKLSELKEIFDKKINSCVSLKNEETIKSYGSNLKEIPTKVDEHIDIASKVDKNLMFSIMNVNTLNREDYIIVMLLFGGFRGRYYSVESISNFLGIEKEYVLEIYNKCLSEYRNTIVNLLSFKDTEMFLKLKQNEENS